MNLVGEATLGSCPDFRDSKMYCTGNAVVLYDLLSGNVGSFRSELAGQSRVDQGDPVCAPFRLIPRNLHSTVGTLNKVRPAFSSFAPSSGFPLLCHHSCLLLGPISIGPYYGFVQESGRRNKGRRPYLHADNVARVIRSGPNRDMLGQGVEHAGHGCSRSCHS